MGAKKPVEADLEPHRQPGPSQMMSSRQDPSVRTMSNRQTQEGKITHMFH